MLGLRSVDRESQETCINIYKLDDFAKVYTCDPAMLTYMEKLREQHPEEVKLATSDVYSNTYHIPKNYVKIKAPKKLSETTLEKLRENAQKYGFSQRNTVQKDT